MVASMGATLFDLVGRVVHLDVSKWKVLVTIFFMTSLQDSTSTGMDVVLLTVLASIILVPATLIRPVYSVSVGYAFSVAFIASVVLVTFPPSFHAWVTHPEGWLCVGLILYGWRLGLFIFLRDILGWKHFPPSSMGKMKNEPRVVMALTLSFLYALMTLPVLPSSRRAHQGDDEAPFPILACVGTAIAWAGGVLETVADFHKQLVKEKAKKIAKKEDDAPRFTGPVTGFYSITRHPNSTSEMIFWLGVWLAGLPSYTTASTWVATTIGSITLVTIMCFDGTPRLEKQQHGRYSGIKEYEEWKCRVPHVLIPCIY